MWAQGLTIGVLIAAGILTQSQRNKAHQNRSVDHSWQNILEEQEREEKEIQSRLAALAAQPVSASAPAPAH